MTDTTRSTESKKYNWSGLKFKVVNSSVKSVLRRNETPEQKQKREQELKAQQLYGKVVFGAGGPQSSFYGSY